MTQLRTTFGQLEGSSNFVVLPSTLSYKERIELRTKHGYEYGRIYNCTSSRGMSVYDRLTADASVRQGLQAMHTPPAASRSDDGLASCCTSTSIAPRSSSRPPSGFVSNNNMPMLTRSLREAEATVNTQSLPLSSLHPITLKSYYKHHPMDFMVAARPAAQTTNQTLRMLGTYSCDAAIARALDVHIPAGAMKPGFHPDVKC